MKETVLRELDTMSEEQLRLLLQLIQGKINLPV